MNNEQSMAAFVYFRIAVGIILVIAFVYLIATNSFNTELISRLLMLIIGLLEAGSGIVAVRASRRKSK